MGVRVGRLAATFRRAVSAHREALAHAAAARAGGGTTPGMLDHRLAAQYQRLADQHQRLALLGRAINAHVSSRPAVPSEVPDPAEALVLARRSADAADAAMTEAETLAARAALLPGLPPQARNLVIYLACALAAVVLQYALLVLSDVGVVGDLPLLGLTCGGLPVLAFLTGYGVISRWGRPRIRAGTFPRNPRLGFAICFLAMPVVYCGLKLLTWLG